MAHFQKASDIRVGVIGYGAAFNMGACHLKEMKQAGMVPTSVTDIDSSRLKVAAKDFPGIETYASVSEMLRKSRTDVLAIITPHNTHTKLAIQCLNAGRHVVSEKPFAITTAECDAMINAARKKGVMLSTYHNRHWDGIILGAMKLVRSGTLGKIVRIDAHMGGWGKPGDWWRGSKSISGGILYDWGVHVLEYTLQIMNADIKEVAGYSWSGVWANQTKWKNDTVEDDAMLVVRYATGATSSLSITSIDSRPHPGFIKVVGTKATCLINWDACEVVDRKDGNVVSTRIPNPEGEGWKFYKNVAAHLTKGTPLVITPEWARRPIHILDLANRSAKLGNALPAKYR